MMVSLPSQHFLSTVLLGNVNLRRRRNVFTICRLIQWTATTATINVDPEALTGPTVASMCRRKLLILCYVSWQTTNCGQTKGHRRRCCCRRRQWNGYFLLLSVFLSSAAATLDHFLRRTKYAKIWSECAGDKCGRTGG